MTPASRQRREGIVAALVFGSLALLAILGWRLFLNAPVVWQLQSVRVTAGDGPVVIGHRELGQRPETGRAAALNHLRLEFRDQRWWLANAAASKRIDAPSSARGTRYVKRWRLAPGDQIRVGRRAADAAAWTIEVESVDDEQLHLLATDQRGSQDRASWQAGRLLTDREPFAGCPESAARWWLRLLDPLRDQELMLFSIGGQVDCARRWRPLGNSGQPMASATGLPLESLRVLWADGAFWLAPGAAADREEVLVTLQAAGDAEPRSFADLRLPIGPVPNGAERVYLGRSGFRFETLDGSDDLLLLPIGGSDVWLSEDAHPLPRDPRVQADYRVHRWVGGGGGPRAWIEDHPVWSGTVLLLAAASLFGYLRARRRRRANPAAALLPLTLVGLGLAGGLWWRPELDARWLFWLGWLGWGWSSVVLLEANRLRGLGGGLWWLAVLLSGSGALVLGQLAAGGDSGRWLGFAVGHWGLWASAGWAFGLLAPVNAHSWRLLLVALFTGRGGFWVGLRFVIPAVLALVLALQLFIGREEGLWGMQPVEAAKLLLVFLLAFAGMQLSELRGVRGAAYRRHRASLMLRVSGFALMFWVIADGLLWAVRDMSPVVILGLLMVALLWKLAPAPAQDRAGRSGRPQGGLLLRSALFVAAGLLLFGAIEAYQNPALVPTWLPQYDRFQVWANPAAHPHSGMQVLMAMDFSGGGGWLGSGPWWGWNGPVMRLPAVQDDFITGFLLYRFGALCGLLLLAVQLAFLLLLFVLARRVAACWVGTERMAGRGVSLALFGLAWLFAAHWIIAWGNVLGLLPVMGQPMTWLAAGNSHLLAFAYPALAFALIVSWSGERAQ